MGWQADARRRICIDFDDVIQLMRPEEIEQDVATISGEPVVGAREAIAALRQRFEVVILSSRADNARGRRAIGKWLREHGMAVDGVTAKKVPALIYVDDRALHFYGDWKETLKDIEHFETWREHPERRKNLPEVRKNLREGRAG